MNKMPILSIVIPIYNESEYIKRNVESLISNRSKNFEIIYIDNCSSDNTVSIIENFTDNRIKLIQQLQKVSPSQNHIDGIEAAQGDYIFISGGDDFFQNCILDQIIPLLENEILLFCKMNLVHSSAEHMIIDYQNSKELIDKIFQEEEFLPNFMRYINHDTLMHSFVPRKFFKNIKKYSVYSLESFWVWMCIHIFSQNGRHCNYDVLDLAVLNKTQSESSTTRDNSYTSDSNKSVFSRFFFTKSLGSIYNAFIFFWQTKNIYHLFILLFSTRSTSRKKTERGGFYGFGRSGIRIWTLAPVFVLIFSPIMDFAKFVLILKRKSR